MAPDDTTGWQTPPPRLLGSGPMPALREDVRVLGEILGDVLRQQEGDALFDLVERVRTLAKGARAGQPQDAERLRGLLGGMDVARALPLARAFTHFLSLTNIAEQHNRVRVRRKQEAIDPARPETLFRKLLAAGVAPDALHAAASSLQIELVLTAHPTQAVRRTLLQKHRRIAGALAQRDRTDLLPGERADVSEQLRREVSAIWLTDELRRQRPTPLDEVRAGLVLFEQVLWDALATYLRDLDRALRATTGQPLPITAAPIRFGSWMGGDRDGNPNVTAAVTEEVFLLHRWMGSELYRREIERLVDELSMVRCNDELRARVGDAHEPYRALLKPLLERLWATRADCEAKLDALHGEAREDGAGRRPGGGAAPLERAEDLWDPLALCHRSLHEVGAGLVADSRLLDVLRRLAALGLTLARVDVRQESGVHARALDVITRAVGLGSYASWSEEERFAFLVRELGSKRPLLPRKPLGDPETQELLDTLAVCARQGRETLGAYVISMATAPSDVLAVHLLQREVGGESVMRVVPLFETLGDLRAAGSVLERLLAEPCYRALIAGRQEVMIGYSDSTKDAGRLAAAWALFTAQEGLVELCRSNGIELTLFHGRGGTIGRGGGPIYLSVVSQPPGSVEGRLRVTVQGEMIEATFGLAGIAIESLGLYANATLEATLRPPAGPRPGWRAIMDRLADDASAAYHETVRDERFVRYFSAATPEGELSRLNIGSRPARRRSGGDLKSLRAIPWSFAWAQTRLHLPAWLGTGEALARAYDTGLEPAIREMASDWPFFRALLDLFEMVLEKADVEIAAYYDEVLVPAELRPIGARLRESLRRATETVLRAKAEKTLLETDPFLRRSIELRNPYVDPLNLLQAEFLRRLREGEDPRLADALLVTINGIAAGMRNTG